jgi:hypothetical protein
MREFIDNAMLGPLQNLLIRVYEFLPNIFAMILILVLGFFIAILVKKFLIVVLKMLKFDQLSFRIGFDNILAKSGIRGRPSEVIGVFFYWVFFFVFIMLAINALNLSALNNVISGFFLFIPNLFAGLGLFFLGYLISIFIERTVLLAAVNAELEFAKYLARGIQILVLIFFMAIALEQIGIGENIVIAAFTIIFGGIVMALSLALGLGGKDIAKQWLEKQFEKRERRENEKDIRSHL